MSEHQIPTDEPQQPRQESIWARVSSERAAPIWTAVYRFGVLSMLAIIALQLGWKGIMVDSLPSVRVYDLPSVSVSDLPSVSVRYLPSVSVSDLPRVSVSSLPSVSIDSLPSVSIDSLPRIKVDALPRIDVDSLPQITLPNPVYVREIGSTPMLRTQ